MTSPAGTPPPETPDGPGNLLHSWKEIATYLGRSVRAAQRWEKDEGLPVRRHAHAQRDSVWARRSDLDEWRARRAGRDSPPAEVPERNEAAREEGRRGSKRPWARRVLLPAGVVAAAGVVVMAASLGSWAWRLPHPAPRAAPTARPLTSDPGLEWGPSLSPDGREVVFAVHAGSAGRPRPEGGKLCRGLSVKDLATGAERALAKGCAGWPRWSPDGTRIAFTRYATPDRADLVWVPAAGGAETVVAQIAGKEAAWTATGAALAVVDRDSEHEPFAIFLVSLDGRSRRRLTRPPSAATGDVALAFSPDGRWLAAVRYQGLARIYVMRADGGEPRAVTDREGFVYGVAWTPSGQLVFSADYDGSGPYLWRLDPTATVAERVPGIEGGARLPTIGGGKLVFENETIDVNLWRRRLGSAEQAQAWAGSTFTDRQPSVSPDGHTVAFSSNRSGNWEIWLADSDGREARALTSSVGQNAAWPRWSADGRLLAFTCRRDGATHVYLVETGGGRLRRLTDTGGDESRPSFSRDGRSVYFAASDGRTSQVWKAPVERIGPRRQVTRDGGFEALEAPDGRTLYFTKDREASGLWKLDLVRGGAPVPVVATLRDGFWSIAKSGIYYVDVRHADEVEGGEPLRRLALTHERVETLAVLPTDGYDLVPGIGLDPTGAALYWSQIDRHTADLMVVDDFR
jgi:Tol biopolymer transport system component